MRTLSTTLLAAQRSVSQNPCIKVEVKNKMTGITRLIWERLYQGTEDEYYHGLTLAGDGSLIRARVTLPVDGCKLYRQRVVNPGSQSDFSVWTYTNQYNCLAVAASSHGSEVSIFWINSNRELRRIKSIDYGASWGSTELLDYSSSTDVHGLSATYKSNGDLAVFFTDQATLYVKKYINGNWQTKSIWDKNTGNLSSVAAVHDNDWNILVIGQDVEGNCKIWSLVYGDGGSMPVGSWSSLKELTSAPANSDFKYNSVFMDKPDVYRASYVEKFSGNQSYNRPFWTHSIPNTDFTSNLWREPVAFDLSCEYGMAIAHSAGYVWLATANGIWRASTAETNLNITSDVVSVRYETLPKDGRLTVELRNDDGRYNSPGQGMLSVLRIGSQLEFSPGYVTTQGNETSPGPVFWLDSWEHNSPGGNSIFSLYGIDGWHLLQNWRARHQFRWNKSSDEMSVKQILEFVFARAGIKLEVKSQSSVVMGFYPDFTIHPDDKGNLIVNRLLSFVPDLIFIEGSKAYLVNPQSTDGSVYSYGQIHAILSGRYRSGSRQLSQVRIEGYDTGSGEPIIVDSFSWEEIEHLFDKSKQITDMNIDTAAVGQTLGSTYLRKTDIESISGMIIVPVNCGQQIYDVIDITDSRAGLLNVKRRVMGIILGYRPDRGEYEQRILLGGV